MRLRSCFALCSAAFICGTALASETFNPANCDFTVAFPGKYETREIFTATGQSTLLAKNPNGQAVKLSAECWPLQPISAQEYAKSLSPKMSQRGIQVQSVTLGKGNYGDVVTLAGTAGEGSDKYYIRFESFFGPKTRLDILILEKSAIASVEHLAFRNSVKVKAGAK